MHERGLARIGGILMHTHTRTTLTNGTRMRIHEGKGPQGEAGRSVGRHKEPEQERKRGWEGREKEGNGKRED